MKELLEYEIDYLKRRNKYLIKQIDTLEDSAIKCELQGMLRANVKFITTLNRLYNLNIIGKNKYDESKFTPPFRVGRKQSLDVLDSKGLLVIMFDKGNEKQAKLYCEYLNN